MRTALTSLDNSSGGSADSRPHSDPVVTYMLHKTQVFINIQ